MLRNQAEFNEKKQSFRRSNFSFSIAVFRRRRSIDFLEGEKNLLLLSFQGRLLLAKEGNKNIASHGERKKVQRSENKFNLLLIQDKEAAGDIYWAPFMA